MKKIGIIRSSKQKTTADSFLWSSAQIFVPKVFLSLPLLPLSVRSFSALRPTNARSSSPLHLMYADCGIKKCAIWIGGLGNFRPKRFYRANLKFDFWTRKAMREWKDFDGINRSATRSWFGKGYWKVKLGKCSTEQLTNVWECRVRHQETTLCHFDVTLDFFVWQTILVESNAKGNIVKLKTKWKWKEI